MSRTPGQLRPRPAGSRIREDMRTTSQLRQTEVGSGSRARLPHRVLSPRYSYWRQGEFIDGPRYESLDEAWKHDRMQEERRCLFVDTGKSGIDGMGERRGVFQSQGEARVAAIEHNRAVDAAQDALECLLRYREMFDTDAPEWLECEADLLLKHIQ